ncbi:hypothetical protein GCM10010992_26550 [Cloacibacterium rupense]|uniref:LURP-one-related family protein n=2 Tax=Cloacibacterium rupense TaxID=517423 RepID=A0ABQ2NLK4_9FLAO|nr:hypothetical protein GCM10010992_26550 [Cloacibacterium rupense]
MQNLQYPLFLKFKITTLAGDFTITDRNENSLAYVRQKLFKLKEDVVVFNDESRSQENFRIKANQWIDFNASYAITDSFGKNIGKIARKGMRSIWKATYNIFDQNENQKYKVQEENAWVKVLDGMVGEIPIIGIFTGYFLNPSYIVHDNNGKEIYRLKKMPSFFGRKFQLDQINDIPDHEETLVVLSLMMMVLLERATG